MLINDEATSGSAPHRGAPPAFLSTARAMDSQTVFGCENAFHAYFNLYAAYTVCKRMCVFVFVFVCVCVCVTAGGVRAQRGPGGSRRDVDRSPTECVLSLYRLLCMHLTRGPQ